MPSAARIGLGRLVKLLSPALLDIAQTSAVAPSLAALVSASGLSGLASCPLWLTAGAWHILPVLRSCGRSQLSIGL